MSKSDSLTHLIGTRAFITAIEFLRSSPQVASQNEIVCAVDTAYPLDKIGYPVLWLGYDSIFKSPTPMTLLAEAYLCPHGPMRKYLSRLNSFGLFSTAEEANELGMEYRELAEVEKVEPLSLFDESFEVLAVGRYVPELAPVGNRRKASCSLPVRCPEWP